MFKIMETQFFLNYWRIFFLNPNTICKNKTQHLSVFRPNTGKYGPEITPYLDTFHAVLP